MTVQWKTHVLYISPVCQGCKLLFNSSIVELSLDHIPPYSAGGGAYSSAALRQTATNIYFPKSDGVTFDQANASQILSEYNYTTVQLQSKKRQAGQVIGYNNIEWTKTHLFICGTKHNFTR